MRRASLLVPLVVFMVIVSGCLGGGNTPTSTPSSASSPAVETTSTTSVEQFPPVKFLYPEKPEIVNLTLEDATEFFREKYSRVPYSQFGNITVNYSNGVFTGVYRFVLTNFTDRTLYLAMLKTEDEPIKLNITIEGVPLNLSRVDRYLLFDEGVGIEFYAVNVSTNLTTLRGIARYEFRYLENEDEIGALVGKYGLLFGTDFSWWEFASKNATIVVTPYLPRDTIFVLFGHGVVRNGSKVIYTSPLHPYLGFSLYLQNLNWTDFSVNDVNVTVYYTAGCYNPEGLELVKKELNFTIGLYRNITGVLPSNRLDVVFVPGLPALSKRLFSEPVNGIDLKGTFLVNCPIDIKDSAVNYASLLFHELAHEWFGRYASFGRLNEAFADYMRVEAYQRWDPKRYPTWIEDMERMAVRDSSQYTYFEAMDPSLPYWKVSGVLYKKGAFILRSLRFVLGNETFNEILHEALTECHGSYCAVQDFQRIAENVSGEDLDWFFNEWFNSTLLPDYNITDLSLSATDNGYNLTFRLIDANNFTMPVELRIVMENGKFVDKTVWVNEGMAEVTLSLEARPTIIVIDPNEWMANINRNFEVDGIEVVVN
ncbi:hypothetical protein E3E23_06440 [Thermococcus sp. CX2]|uniref:M1 family metallopeptidase n=1 Tax=Thermococcus sp. CX2 TaxID=163006 RepID=UPI00143B8215|nr:M1 family metallopeptidase [Thermococcus sp. CX2]NJE85461.1 hypothetical protein [Thermococcus sp. CX2]